MSFTTSYGVNTQLVGRVPVLCYLISVTAIHIEARRKQDDSVHELSEVVGHLAEAVDHLGCAL